MMRGIATTIGIVGMCLLSVTGRLGAQEARQDAAQLERGRQIAEKICWVCHVIGRDQVLRNPGPDFREIAKGPDTTAESLRAFLHTTHRTEGKPYMMPNPMLNDEMIDAVVSYILSLRLPS